MSDRLDNDKSYDDPIVSAIHETRRKILARFGNDIEAYVTYVANRRIPGARYVDTRSDSKPGFSYSSVIAPEGAGVLFACEPKP